MLRGLYTAASGLVTQQKRHDAITNNIANLTTPGYKAQDTSIRAFPEMLIQLMKRDGSSLPQSIGRINTGVMLEEILPIFKQGTLQETGIASDIALLSAIRVTEIVAGEEVEIRFDANGKGTNQAGETVYQPQAFYTVLNDANEIRYTRNGQLYADAEGTLRNTDGHRVMGRDGAPITLDRPLEEVRIAPNGMLLNAEGQPIAGTPAIAITRVENPFALIREGNGSFRLDEELSAFEIMTDPTQFSVRQGYIEHSNVDPAQSMVDMMTALRAYEANQKVIQFYDRSMEKAVNEVGRV